MSLTQFSLKRPIASFMLILFFFLLGGLFYLKTPVDLIPQLSVPSLMVITSFPGAPQEKVEKEVTSLLEDFFSQISGLKKLHSSSREEESIIILNFDWGKKINTALQEVKETVRAIKLPQGVSPPSIQRWASEDVPVLRIDLTSANNEKLSRWVKKEVKPGLERIKGAGKVIISGDEEREVFVFVSPGKLRHYKIPINTVTQKLVSYNLNALSGKIDGDREEYLIRVFGKFHDIEEIKNLIVKSESGSSVRLKDIAEIKIASAEQKHFSRLQGKNSISLSIIKEKKANTLKVISSAKKEFEKISKNASFPFEFEITRDDSEYIKEAQSIVKGNMIIGAAGAVLVLFLFLRNFYFTLLITLSMPLSLISAFVFFRFFNVTNNVLSLAGLALGLGMILDSSIVILENIYTHFKNSGAPFYATLAGTNEVEMSVMASCLTTLVVFLPILGVKGVAGKLFGDLSIAVIAILLFSLLISFTVIPFFMRKILEKTNLDKMDVLKSKGISGKFTGIVDKFIDSLIQHPFIRMCVVLIVFALSFLSLFFLPPMVFIPEGKEREVRIQVKMAEGTSMEDAEKFCSEIENLARVEKVENIVSGGSSQEFDVWVKVAPYKEKGFIASYISDFLSRLRKIPLKGEVKLSKVDKISSAGGLGKPVEIKITGDNFADIREKINYAFQKLNVLQGIANLSSPGSNGSPQLTVDFKRSALDNFNISSQDAARQLAVYMQGEKAGKLEDDEDALQIWVKSAGGGEGREFLSSLPLISSEGNFTYLSAVSDFKAGHKMKEITHYNQRRNLSISCDVASGHALGKVLEEIKKTLGSFLGPAGGRWHIEGVSRSMMESFSQLKNAFLISLFLIYIIMAAQFESLSYPLVIITTLPLSFIGIVAGLNLLGENLSIPAMIGIIMLAGIVVNNGIILIDFINILRNRGLERAEAIKRAVLSRLRPIFMTSLTTILGMLPMVLGIGSGAELYRGLAIVVSFGLFFSTFLTIFIVPSVYILIDDIKEFFGLYKLKIMKFPPL